MPCVFLCVRHTQPLMWDCCFIRVSIFEVGCLDVAHRQWERHSRKQYSRKIGVIWGLVFLTLIYLYSCKFVPTCVSTFVCLLLAESLCDPKNHKPFSFPSFLFMVRMDEFRKFLKTCHVWGLLMESCVRISIFLRVYVVEVHLAMMFEKRHLPHSQFVQWQKVKDPRRISIQK